jgi:eukaryotic-like serine/threonine-protein kinase
MDAVLDVDLSGDRVSHYAIVGIIASGGMGKVYLGRDEHLRRHVAIKVLSGERSTDLDTSRGLLTEARLLSRFIHPYVAAIYDFIKQAGREYIVMEFVPGATIKEVISAGPLPSEEVARLGVQLARGLAAAHAARVLHRDLKPQNIKLTPSGRLKILDFGVAALIPPRLIDSSVDTPSASYPAGTVPYMSPEQLRGEVLDERSDIFSAGAVLYEMATGQPAFPQRHLAQLVDAIQHQDPAPLTAANPFVPKALERIVFKALQKDPNRRHQRAGALATELRALRSAPRPRSSPRAVEGITVVGALPASVAPLLRVARPSAAD